MQKLNEKYAKRTVIVVSKIKDKIDALFEKQTSLKENIAWKLIKIQIKNTVKNTDPNQFKTFITELNEMLEWIIENEPKTA